MADRLNITEARLIPGSSIDEAAGLLAYVELVVNDRLRLGGMTLRRTRGGRKYLAFPARVKADGSLHPIFRPVGDMERLEFQERVFAALGIEESAG